MTHNALAESRLSKLIAFGFPSIMMWIFTSIYTVVDGFFVSNFVGKIPFAALNFIFPFVLVLGSFGFMFGTGGGALVAKTIGEGESEKANAIFSFVVYSSLLCGIIMAIVGIVSIRPFAIFLGAEGQFLEDSILYGRILLLAIPAYILQTAFQCLFATAGKPAIGFYVTLAAGIVNIILDAIFIVIFSWGLAGSAFATLISQCVGGFVPLLYFARNNPSLLRLGRAKWSLNILLKTCTNGLSELLSNIAMSIVAMLYNVQLLKYAGEDGVATFGVLMYVGMIFQAIFIGFSLGNAPIISYHYGAQNRQKLHEAFKNSLIFIASCALVMFAASLIFAKSLAAIFVGYDEGLFALTIHAFSIFSFSFLFSGFAVFGSSFFTALNDGITSATISFLRTLVFEILAVLILPIFWLTDGIWASIVVADVMAMLLTIFFLWLKRKKYQY